MRNPIAKVSTTYGAPMGRADGGPQDPDFNGKVSLRRIRLDSGGYDSGGAYWGTGQPLYWAGSDDGEIDMYFRASSRTAAKAHVRSIAPAARFYN